MATEGKYGRSRSSLRSLFLENASPLTATDESETKESKLPGESSEFLDAKQKTNRCSHGRCSATERRNRNNRFRSLCQIGKGVGCKVGTCDEIIIFDNQKSAPMESITPRRSLLRAPQADIQCCSHGISDLIRKKNSNKFEVVRSSPPDPQFPLPDDLLEACLLRLPFLSLQAARLVCKRWMHLTISPQFLKRRSRYSVPSSWLFLFGVTREGSSGEEIYALDTFHDQWHTIRADSLSARSFSSVIASDKDIYVVGGRSPDKMTRRDVLVFRPFTGKWREVSPLRTPRSRPVLGVVKVSSRSSLNFRSQSRRLKDHLDDENRRTLPKSRFLLIAVGGRGSSDEPLDSAEMYDSMADSWSAIKSPPGLGGAACSAAAHGGALYLVSETCQLARYDPETGLWTRILTSSAPPRLQAYRPAIISCDRRLFMLSVSWGRAEKAQRKLWELDLELAAWSEASSHPDAPMDLGAVFVADRTRIYGIEMFRIFGQLLDFLTSCDVSAVDPSWKRFSAPHFASSSGSRKSMVVIPL